MENMRMNKAVRRVVQIKSDGAGNVHAVQVYENKKKKRTSKELRWAEKQVKRIARAQRAAADVYLQRHEKSGARRDGWISDFGDNVYRAIRRFSKVVKLT